MWILGEWEMVMALGWNWMFRQHKEPLVLGEQLCALGTWGGTSGLVEGEDLKVTERKMQWDEHHQSQEYRGAASLLCVSDLTYP